MRRLAIILIALIAAVLVLSVIGYGYAQGNETGGGVSSGCCAFASAYDATDAENLDIIREFRDKYLMTTPAGRGVVVLYYDVFSPPVAGFINDHPAVKPFARAAWTPAVAISTVAVDTTTAEKVVIAGSLAVVSAGLFLWVQRRRGGGTHPS